MHTSYKPLRGGLFFLGASVLLIMGSLYAIGAVRAESHEISDASASSTVLQLRREIEARNQEIKRLEALAETYRDTIATTQDQAQTLKNEITGINRAITRLRAEINVILERVKRTNLEIKSLAIQIREAESDIDEKRTQLQALLRALAAADEERPFEALLQHGNLSRFLNQLEALENLQKGIVETISELRSLHISLSENKKDSETKVTDLKQYASQLNDKTQLQLSQQQERNRILAETQNQEKRYQELLAETEQKRQALQDEINAYERTLRFTLDPKALPQSISGVLAWPLAVLEKPLIQCNRTVWVFLTQCFGVTAFSQTGAYNGRGHNGIDFRASIGTEIYAAEAGTIRGTGDTDQSCRRASYGKWILIDHDNGLTTVYGHLSLIKVSPGERVGRGDLIGYSGNTGYATGPHLHLSVFAHDAVKIGNLQSKVCGRLMTLPLSPFNGYLNPLNYL